MEHEAAQYLDRLVYRGGVAFQALRVFLVLGVLYLEAKKQSRQLFGVVIFFFNFIMEMSHSNVGWNHHHFF